MFNAEHTSKEHTTYVFATKGGLSCLVCTIGNQQLAQLFIVIASCMMKSCPSLQNIMHH